MKPNVDCFGYLFDDNLTPCREQCLVRHECRKTLAHNLKAQGQKNFQKQRHDILAGSKLVAKALSLTPEISELVSEVIETFKSLGLKPVFKRYYITFKDSEGRSQLHVSRFQSEKLQGLVRLVNLKAPNDLPVKLQRFIGNEKCCGHYPFIGSSIDELKTVVTTYLGESQT